MAALVDGENTLKRLVKETARVYLKAENRDYPNIEPQEKMDHPGRGSQRAADVCRVAAA